MTTRDGRAALRAAVDETLALAKRMDKATPGAGAPVRWAVAAAITARLDTVRDDLQARNTTTEHNHKHNLGEGDVPTPLRAQPHARPHA